MDFLHLSPLLLIISWVGKGRFFRSSARIFLFISPPVLCISLGKSVYVCTSTDSVFYFNLFMVYLFKKSEMLLIIIPGIFVLRNIYFSLCSLLYFYFYHYALGVKDFEFFNLQGIEMLSLGSFKTGAILLVRTWFMASITFSAE